MGNEMVSAAISCIAITLVGLALGFGLLKFSATLTDRLVKWQAVQATQDLAASENAKVVIIGSGKEGLPVILGNQ